MLPPGGPPVESPVCVSLAARRFPRRSRRAGPCQVRPVCSRHPHRDGSILEISHDGFAASPALRAEIDQCAAHAAAVASPADAGPPVLDNGTPGRASPAFAGPWPSPGGDRCCRGHTPDLRNAAHMAVLKNIVYENVAGQQETLDLYLPRGTPPARRLAGVDGDPRRRLAEVRQGRVRSESCSRICSRRNRGCGHELHALGPGGGELAGQFRGRSECGTLGGVECWRVRPQPQPICRDRRIGG